MATKQASSKASTPSTLRATTTFVCDVDGDPMVVHEGEVVSAKHVVVKGREHLFEPAVVPVDHG